MKMLNYTTLALASIMFAADKGTATGGKGREYKLNGVDDAMAEQAAARGEYVTDEKAWDNIDAPEFGGQSEILVLAIGEVAADLLYTGHQESTIGDKQVQVHTANTKEGTPVRLPIAASFGRALDAAGVNTGDTIAIRRYEDVAKKGGVGKGQQMAIFAVKVQKKANQG